MFSPRKHKTFVDINFSPHRRRNILLKLKDSFSQLNKTYLIGSTLSAASFVGIFVSAYIFQYLINRQKEQIEKLEFKIRQESFALNHLKRRYRRADERFKDFLVFNFKEKLFFVLYTRSFNKKVWKTVETFREIVGSTNPFLGFVVYPNPFSGFKYGNYSSLPDNFHKIVYKRVLKNFFLSQNGTAVENPTLLVENFEIKPEFEKSLRKIKEENLRLNLLLEYGFIYKHLENLKTYTPPTLIFPLNLAFPSEGLYEKKLSKLKDFCNELVINKEYRKEIYVNNSLKTATIMDGYCLKNVY